MSTSDSYSYRPNAELVDTSLDTWSSAVLAGMLAGVAMGVPMQYGMGIMDVVGALYGSQDVATGWAAHMFHSVVFALAFAGLVSLPRLRDRAHEVRTALPLALGYGVVLWIFGAVLAMPLWLEAAGLPNPGVPNLNPMSLMGHLVYGVVLGVSFPGVLRLTREFEVEADTDLSSWLSAVAAAVVAGVAMGLPMHLVMDVMPAVAALYGAESVAAGWLAHLFHSVVFGVVYGAAANLPRVGSSVTDLPSGVLVGAVYGVGLWVFGAVYAMPLWMQSIGMDAAAPNWSPTSLLTHLLFGALLGLLYPVFLDLWGRI